MNIIEIIKTCSDNPKEAFTDGVHGKNVRMLRVLDIVWKKPQSVPLCSDGSALFELRDVDMVLCAPFVARWFDFIVVSQDGAPLGINDAEFNITMMLRAGWRAYSRVPQHSNIPHQKIAALVESVQVFDSLMSREVSDLTVNRIVEETGSINVGSKYLIAVARGLTDVHMKPGCYVRNLLGDMSAEDLLFHVDSLESIVGYLKNGVLPGVSSAQAVVRRSHVMEAVLDLVGVSLYCRRSSEVFNLMMFHSIAWGVDRFRPLFKFMDSIVADEENDINIIITWCYAFAAARGTAGDNICNLIKESYWDVDHHKIGRVIDQVILGCAVIWNKDKTYPIQVDQFIRNDEEVVLAVVNLFELIAQNYSINCVIESCSVVEKYALLDRILYRYLSTQDKISINEDSFKIIAQHSDIGILIHMAGLLGGKSDQLPGLFDSIRLCVVRYRKPDIVGLFLRTFRPTSQTIGDIFNSVNLSEYSDESRTEVNNVADELDLLWNPFEILPGYKEIHNKDDECSVCLEKLEPGQSVVKCFVCEEMFHAHCFESCVPKRCLVCQT